MTNISLLQKVSCENPIPTERKKRIKTSKRSTMQAPNWINLGCSHGKTSNLQTRELPPDWICVFEIVGWGRPPNWKYAWYGQSHDSNIYKDEWVGFKFSSLIHGFAFIVPLQSLVYLQETTAYPRSWLGLSWSTLEQKRSRYDMKRSSLPEILHLSCAALLLCQLFTAIPILIELYYHIILKS